jgi:Ca2+-binding RTX toxin-like protein
MFMESRLTPTAALLAALVISAPAAAAPEDAPILTAQPSAFGVGSTAQVVVAADLNLDGRVDAGVLTGGRTGGSVSQATGGELVVLLGDGGGGFGAGSRTPLGDEFVRPDDVAVARLDNDPDPDLVVTEHDLSSGAPGSRRVRIFLNRGDGSFDASTALSASGNRFASVATGDLNGDGHEDALLGDTDSSALLVLVGDGAGHLSPGPVTAMPGGPTSVALGRLDGDATLDAAVSTTQGAFALRGLGTGAFGPPVELSGGDGGVSVADLNVDGRQDILVARQAFQVMLHTGDGNLAFQTSTIPTTLETRSAQAGDVDGDGVPELIVGEPRGVAVLEGLGGGAFGSQVLYGFGGLGPNTAFLADIAVADLNSDGRPDVVGGLAADSGETTANDTTFGLAATLLGGAGQIPRCSGRQANAVAGPGATALGTTDNHDVVVARSGKQRLLLYGGNDVVCAGGGNDSVDGGRGRDRLLGGSGSDRLKGGRGRDVCVGGGGRDRARTCETTRSVP